jgi:hypothetical protein
LVFLGEDRWRDLLDLAASCVASWPVGSKASTLEVHEDRGDEIGGGLDEVTGRPYESLDLSEGPCEDFEVPDWPEGWDEEKIWGDTSPQEWRSLKRLLGSRTPKRMDT